MPCSLRIPYGQSGLPIPNLKLAALARGNALGMAGMLAGLRPLCVAWLDCLEQPSYSLRIPQGTPRFVAVSPVYSYVLTLFYF